MLVWSGVHPATFASVLIEAECVGKDGELVVAQEATGFIYRHLDSTYLVTNWHVVTGRNPDDPLHMLIDAHDSPVRLTFCLARRDNHNWFLPGHINLYEKGRPVWFEVNDDTGSRIDLVIIKVLFPDDSYVVAVQDFVTEDRELIVGDDVVVIGFPFGRYEKNPHAIWKRAMVASEPGIALSGRVRFFIDVAGRPGMSGSPVYSISDAFKVSARAAQILRDPNLDAPAKIQAISPSDLSQRGKSLHLVGVYSGSLVEGVERSLGLGFCWHSFLIEGALRNPRPGYNPEPPTLHGQ